MPQPRKLCRSTHDRIIAGVCAGLAEHFETDPVLLRVIFVVLAFAGGSGVLLYVILWLVLPDENFVGSARAQAQPLHSSAYHGARRLSSLDDHLADLRARMQGSHNHAHGFLGTIVVIFGAFLLLDGFYPQINFSQVIGIIVILFGVVLIFLRHDGQA